MIFSSEQLDILATKYDGKKYLRFNFFGKFTKNVCESACAVWTDELNSNGDYYCFIWDCSKMDGFEIAAKNHWYSAVKGHENRISKVTVISDNVIVRGAARLMLKMFRFESNVLKFSTREQQIYT